MTRPSRISASFHPLRASIAVAVTAMLAACGGGGSADAGSASAAAQAAPAPAAAAAPFANALPVSAPVVADQGPIAPHLMDAATQTELLMAAADVKPTPAPAPTETKAPRADTGVPATGGPADTANASVPSAAVSLNGFDNTGTRSGGRAVPLPSVATTSTSPSPTPSPAPSPSPAPAPSPSPSPAPSPTPSPAPAPSPTAPTTANGGGTTGEAQMIQAISNADIRLQVDPDRLFNSYKWLWGMECAGYKEGALNIPETGLHGFDLGGNLGSMRFGKVADPEDASRRVLMFRPNMNDPQIYGGPRCEMTFSPNFAGKLPVNQDVWFAFGIRFQDWNTTTDEQVLMQWHWSNGSIPIGPFLALAMKGGRLQIDSKANAAYPPTVAGTTTTVQWTGNVVPNSWSYFVVKARISPNPADAPYLKVWRDGTQIVNHQGPFGYNYPEVTPYLKIGHYQWIASYNTWSSMATTKTMLVRKPALVNDTANRYTEADLRAHVKNR